MPNIHDLPPEILGHILKSLHREMMKREGEVDMGLAAVCLTCKRWKDFAFSTPELWSCIEIIVDLDIKILPSYAKVSDWLSRSRNQPLSLVIMGERLRQSESTTALLQLLIAHSHRWYRISLCFGPHFGVVELPDNFLAPILESATSESLRPGFKDNHLFYEKLLRGAPALRKFTYQGYDWAYFLPNRLHLEPLRSFDLKRFLSASYALTILERGVNLQTCSLQIAGCNGPPAKPVTSSVGCLSLLVDGVDGPKEFFRFLDAWSLTNLSIIFSEPRYAYEQNTLFYILSKTHSRLSTLTITNVEIPEDKFIDCLILLSELATLRIMKPLDVTKPIENQISNKIMNLLTFQGGGSPKPLCPLLETITLELCVRADDGLLSEMVQSRHCSPNVLRKDGVAILKELDAVLPRSMHTLDEEGLKKLYEEGLRGSLKLI
jgi:hypothetical protein